jgi:hypothetical protein
MDVGQTDPATETRRPAVICRLLARPIVRRVRFRGRAAKLSSEVSYHDPTTLRPAGRASHMGTELPLGAIGASRTAVHLHHRPSIAPSETVRVSERIAPGPWLRCGPGRELSAFVADTVLSPTGPDELTFLARTQGGSSARARCPSRPPGWGDAGPGPARTHPVRHRVDPLKVDLARSLPTRRRSACAASSLSPPSLLPG